MLVTVTVIILVAGAGNASCCPHYCKCLWRASKITVDCTGKRDHSPIASLY